MCCKGARVPEIRDPILAEPTPAAASLDADADIDEFAPERRKQDFKEATWFYRVRVCFLLATSVVASCIVIVYLWHLVMPHSARWLDTHNVAEIKDLAVTIIVGLSMSFTTTYFFKRK